MEIQQQSSHKTHSSQISELTSENSNLLNIFNHNTDGILVVSEEGEVLFANPAAETMLSRKAEDLVGANFGFPILSGDETELNLVRKDNKNIQVKMRVVEMNWEGSKAYLVSLHDITVQKQREQEMKAIISLNEMLQTADSLEAMYPVIIRFLWKSLHADASALALHSHEGNLTIIKQSFGMWADWEEHKIDKISGIHNQFVFLKEPYSNNQLQPEDVHFSGLDSGDVTAIACMPLTGQKKLFGSLLIGRETPFSESEMRIFRAASNIAANAIHRANLLKQTESRMNRLMALRAIDVAITSSMDMQITLNVCLDHVVSELKADAACILLMNPVTQTLDYAAGTGFITRDILSTALHIHQNRLGQSRTGKEVHMVPNVHQVQTHQPLPDLFKKEDFTGCFYFPLISKGVLKGALEIFRRDFFQPTLDWTEFAKALSSQAAIAIDNATLFDELQRFSIELTLSYDATIEGWARAVSLRDSDTEGHTRRVTDLTLQLAKAMHYPESDLANLRRGAILHDIGKLAIPDKILLKPGPLNVDEWEVMRKHPQIAYDLLAQIPFLRTALDIPLYHHERWDGSGYPKGLKGYQIPFSARIFAVADVWDALTSDRPYRKAISNEEAMGIILSSAGSHFDPYVVEAFTQIIKPSPSASPKTPTKPGILIVDDEENVVKSLKRALRSEYQVFTATSTNVALEILQQDQIDVILTDQRMPQMTGLQLLKEAKKLKPEIVGVMISGYSDPLVLAEALNIGTVRGFVNKPWDSDELRLRLLEAIDYQNKAKKANGNNEDAEGGIPNA